MAYELNAKDIKEFETNPEQKQSSFLRTILSGPRSGMAMLPGQVAGFASMMMPEYAHQFHKLGQSYGEQIAGGPTSAPGIGEMVTQAGATAGSPFLAPLLVEAAQKGKKYLETGKAAEEFRNELGTGTSRENITEVGKRVEHAAKTAKAEALIPKTEFEQAAKGKRILPKVEVEQPDLARISKIFNKDLSDFDKDKHAAFQKAIKSYYKTGNIDTLVESGHKIFDLDEPLREKDIANLESELPFQNKKIPVGSYGAIKDVTMPYSVSGNLQKLHNRYMKNPSYENADALKSELSKQSRGYWEKSQKSGLTDTEIPRYEAIKANKAALEKDMDKFAATLPPEQRNKYNEFREKYRKYAETYESGNPVLQNLAGGKSGEVHPGEIEHPFTHSTEQVKTILKDIGPEGRKQILFDAVRNVPEGDAHKLAKTILDLKKTKGFDAIVTPQMEKWANHMIKRFWITKAMQSTGLGLMGEGLGGHMGGAAAASIPFLKMGGEKALEFLKALRK